MPTRMKTIVTLGRPARGRLFAVVLILLLAAMSQGCGIMNARSQSDPGSGLGVRPAGDTARLLQNAHYYKMMGRPEMALRELEQAYQGDPENYKTANTLAELYEGVGNFKRAQQIYQETLARDGNNGVLANNLCFTYYLAGDLNQAEACFRRTLERQPNNTAARNNLGMVLCRLGRQEEAKSLWQAAEGQVAAALKVQQVTAALGMESPAPAGSQPMIAKAGTAPQKQAVPAAEGTAPKPPLAEAGSNPGIPPKSVLVPKKASGPAPAPAQAETPARTASAEQVARKLSSPDAAAAAVTKQAAAAKPQPAPGDRSQTDTAPFPARSGSTADLAPPPAKAAADPVPVPTRVALPASDSASARQLPAIPPVREITRPGTVRPAPLTAKELEETAIEVRNGNGTQNLARETRSRLDQEGFNVVSIGNYIDFGVNTTTIFYRPQAEKVARALGEKFFQKAQLTPTGDLAENLDIKVLLGRELLTGQQVTASRPQLDKSL